MRLVLRPVALAELEAARTWYDEQRTGLGSEFSNEADHAIGHIAEAPAAFPQLHGSIRRLLMRRFPYGIFYHYYGNEVVILAVMHLRRDPRRWEARG